MSSYCRVGAEDSKHAEWETATWPFLNDLAEKTPEAAIHFQGIFFMELANSVWTG